VIVTVGCGGGGSGDLDGYWERSRGSEVFEFSGNRFTFNANQRVSRGGFGAWDIWYGVVASGTFTITDNQIEFITEYVEVVESGDRDRFQSVWVFSRHDQLVVGEISVFPFSRTENTISILGEQFSRAD